MDFGLTNKVNEFVWGNLFQQNHVTDKTDNTSFSSVLAALRADNINNQNLEGMLKTKYPELKYHVLDTSKISQSLWERQDYPFENFLEDDLDESILDWKPSGANPSMLDQNVQARFSATIGMKAVVIPPELEEKMKNDPELAQSIMDKVTTFIEESDARVMGKRTSHTIVFDENGNISHYRTIVEGGGLIMPSEEEIQKNKDEKAEQERIARQAVVRCNKTNDKTVMSSGVSLHMQANSFIAGENNVGYLQIAPYIATSYRRRW